MRKALLTLTAAISASTAAFAAEPVAPNPQADALIAQLNSRSFAEREAASKSLHELGPAALPALNKALAENPNPEVQVRAADLVAKIQLQADVALLTQGKPVSFDFKDKPLSAAVAELRAKTGIPLNLHPTVKEPTRLITAKVDELPPWQAIELFCVAAGVTEQLKPDAKADAKAQPGGSSGRRPIRRNIEVYDGAQLGAQLLGRPGDVAVVLVDGKSTLPADRRGGVRIQALPLSYPGSGIDRNVGELTLNIDVAPQQGLNWVYTSEIRIGRAITGNGRELQSVWKPDLTIPMNPYGYEELQMLQSSIEVETPVKSNRTNPRVLPVTFKIPEGDLKSLGKLEGLILGEIAQPNQPIISVDNIAEMIGTSFGGPGDSSLTLVSMKTDEKSNATTLVLRASSPSPWAGRRGGAFSARTGDTTINFQSFSKIRYTDADGKAMTQPVIQQSSSMSDGIRDTYEVTVRFGTGSAKTAPKPVKMVLTGTKIVSVALPFKLKDVPLE